MSLIKRSVVLYKDQTKGVFTVIRLGETVGAKVVLNEPIKKPMWIGIKLGEEVQQNFVITKQVTELSLQCALCFNDSIGVIVLDDSGSVYAYGGVREKVSVGLIKESAANALIESAPLPVIESIPVQQKAEKVINAVVEAEPVTVAEAEANPLNANDIINVDAITQAEPQAVLDEFEPIAEVADDAIKPVFAEPEDEPFIAAIENDTTPVVEEIEPEAEPVEAVIEPEVQTVFAAKPKTKPVSESQAMEDNDINMMPNPIHAKPPTAESEEDFKRNRYAKGTAAANRVEPIQDNMNKTKTPEQPQWVPEKDKKVNNNPFNIPKAKNFYQAIRGRLEEIMTINPKESELEKLIPDSDWVKVRYDGEEYYVVGRLYENNIVTYIGYGVPGVENVRPPKEADELCDFLPLPKRNGAGYWLMFQKADDGTISRDI